MGNMFYRGQPINVIENMTYHDLKYWNGWHEKMDDQLKDDIEKYKNA